MKVAFIIPSLAHTGLILVVKDLVSGLVKRGIPCEVYYFDDIYEVEMAAPVKKISFFQRFPFNEFDIVHSHGLRPNSYVFFHKPRACSARCIATLHAYLKADLSYNYSAFTTFIADKLWRFFLKRQDRLVVLTRNAKAYYEQWFPSEKIDVIYNSREIELSCNDVLNFESDIFKLKQTYTIIGANALLNARKGIEQLVDVLTLLPHHAIVIVGDGKERQNLEQRAIQNGVANRCLFIGFQQNAQRYLKFYDIFAMPSRSEGFPLALLEAAQYRKNTICSNIDIFQELFSEEDLTFFELDNLNSLASAILSASRIDKGEHLYETFLKKYSMNIFIESYLRVYEIKN